MQSRLPPDLLWLGWLCVGWLVPSDSFSKPHMWSGRGRLALSMGEAPGVRSPCTLDMAGPSYIIMSTWNCCSTGVAKSGVLRAGRKAEVLARHKAGGTRALIEPSRSH